MIFFPSFYHIKKIKDHSIEKERLLSVCSTFDYAYRNTDEEKRLDYYSYISNTNWQFKESMYEGTFSKRDRKELEEYICKKYSLPKLLRITNTSDSFSIKINILSSNIFVFL